MLPTGAEPFVAAVVSRPDDDLPRLVFADWLDEHDDPERAEFIRIQCRLAESGGGPLWASMRPQAHMKRLRPDADELQALEHRQTELWAENRTLWMQELPECLGSTLLFRRGFVDEVAIRHPGGLMRDSDSLFALAPVTAISFWQPALELLRGPLERAGWLSRIARLKLVPAIEDYTLGDDAAELLANSPGVAGVRELSLPASDMSDRGAFSLASSAFARQLTRLDLSQNRIGNHGAERLAEVLSPDSLKWLNLSGNPILPEHRRRLMARFPDRVHFGSARE